MLAALPFDIKYKIFENDIKNVNEAIPSAEKIQQAQTAASLTSSIPEDRIHIEIAHKEE